MSAPIRLNKGDVWEFRGQRMIFQSELGDNLIHFMRERNGGPFQLEDHDGATRWPNVTWLLEQLANGSLKKVQARFAQSPRRKASAFDDDHEALNKLDKNARLRAFVVRGLDAMGDISRSDRSLTRAMAQLWAEQPEKAAQFGSPPCTRSVRRWLKERGLPGERRLNDMVARNGRVERERRFPEVTLALMRRWAAWYWTRAGWEIGEAYARFAVMLEYINRRRLKGRVLPLLKRPSYETFRLEARKLESFETYALKFGAKKANARFKVCGEGLSASRFLRLGCMDHTVLDSFAVIDPNWMLPVGRPWVTILIDVRTRCIVGFVLSFEPPSIYSVMECIKRANRPKIRKTSLSKHYPVLGNIFGRFDEIVVDNGKEFAGVAFEDALADVGTTLRLAPIATPTHKAVGERFFLTLNQMLNTKLPGAVFRPDVLREMGYDPAKDAVLTIEQLDDLINEAIATYHVSMHSGIGAQPARLWQADIDAYGIDMIDDDRRLDAMMGAVKHQCRVSRSGVSLFGLQFHDQAKVGGLLQDLISREPVRGQRKGSAVVTVKVKYNPANLSEIHVFNRRRNRYVTLPCLDKRYTAGMSLWHHRKVQEWAKHKGLEFNTEIQRLAARAGLVELVENSAPHLKGAARNAMRRILTPPTVEGLGEGGVTLAYAPARHDGLAPINHYALAADTRTDHGQTPSRPARPKKLKRKQQKGRGDTGKTPSSGQARRISAFTVNSDLWKETEL